jgi:hypothetical protein
MKRVDRRGRLALAFLALAFAACARIDRFVVEPRRVCEGEEVRLSWAASGRVRLDASPAHPIAGAKSDEGEQRVAVDRTTAFTLSARGLLRDDARQVDVVVAPPPRGFGEVAACGADELHTRFTLGQTIAEGLRVEALRNVLDRALFVAKDGRSVRLEPGERSDALRGTSVRGTWALTSPLAPGESCEQALASIRQRLQVEIDMGCGS